MLSWIKGNTEPVTHTEDLLHEVIEDEEKYVISIKEERLNGKIRNILIKVIKED